MTLTSLFGGARPQWRGLQRSWEWGLVTSIEFYIYFEDKSGKICLKNQMRCERREKSSQRQLQTIGLSDQRDGITINLDGKKLSRSSVWEILKIYLFI